ncbi:MAG TPA: ferritin-like domain-containing protein [Myxococcota bacterium]|jgi:hypothetical protein|nr:ferritin-like domain-containing protein [Myxococcota bacterium]
MTPDPTLEVLRTAHDLTYTWSYASSEKDLKRLYEMAKRDQWNGADLAWDADVDPEKEYVPDAYIGIWGSDIWDKLTPREVRRVRVEMTSWMLSQFMHGEQGALMSTAQLVTAVPAVDAKFYGATQVMDEARHLEVFHRYLTTKVRKVYAPNVHLRKMLDAILTDSRWDMKYLGMQVILEGLALAAFGLIRDTTSEPLLRELLVRVMRDESRHVAFGVLSLRDFYEAMPERERREREDFIYEASVMMRNRFLAEEVWLEMGLPLARCVELVENAEATKAYRQLLFSRMVPNLKQLGLLSDRLRGRFAELDILQFEDFAPAEDMPSFEPDPTGTGAPQPGAAAASANAAATS